jgi:hypothetical protein
MDDRGDNEEDDESSCSCHGWVVVIKLESAVILTAREIHDMKRL